MTDIAIDREQLAFALCSSANSAHRTNNDEHVKHWGKIRNPPDKLWEGEHEYWLAKADTILTFLGVKYETTQEVIEFTNADGVTTPIPVEVIEERVNVDPLLLTSHVQTPLMSAEPPTGFVLGEEYLQTPYTLTGSCTDVTVIATDIPSNRISFGTAGYLTFNNSILEFHGNVEESAKLFFEYLVTFFNARVVPEA